MPLTREISRDLRQRHKQLAFLSAIPYADANELQPHQKTCSICHDDFSNDETGNDGGTLNRPVRLSCGRKHIVAPQPQNHD